MTNRERYSQLQEKYKIANAYSTLNRTEYDVVFTCISACDEYFVYQVLKNKPRLYSYDLAVICHSGEDWKTYSVDGTRIKVYIGGQHED